MSSIKRLSVMAALSHFNGHENHNNSTMTPSTFTITTTSRTIANPQTTAEVTISSLPVNARIAYNHQNNISSSPQIGGLGLLHQQNLRNGGNGANVGSGGNGGSGGNNGGSAYGGYSSGSWSGGAPVMGGNSGSNGGSSHGSSDGSYSNINGNVNILLGGAMLSVVTTVLCVVCYCCHRNIKKRTEAAYRQRWMETDTNMEIYSVEQCYETSGLFLESTEGIAVPALTHEPPPSYDAVMVAMQDTNHHHHNHHHHQHQHHQHHHQQANRISPPPDYRSMNDVSGSSAANVNEDSKFITNTGGNVVSNSLRIKKVLNAQSCCSLQRAEAENLYQLGIVAAATTSATSGRFTASALGRKSLPYITATQNLAQGRRYGVNQAAYYQGCPLCGKFRYGDDSMSLSSDSGLDQVVVTVDVNNGNTSSAMPSSSVGGDSDTCYCTPMQSPTVVDQSNNNNNTVGGDFADDAPHATIDDRTWIANEQPMISPHAKYENIINNNNNCVADETPTIRDDGAVTATILSSSLSPAAGGSSQAAETTTNEASTSDNHRDTTATNTTDNVMLELDSINDNGIIRLDMSKIIDKTGLPTYEAALKLESSGYV